MDRRGLVFIILRVVVMAVRFRKNNFGRFLEASESQCLLEIPKEPVRINDIVVVIDQQRRTVSL